MKWACGSYQEGCTAVPDLVHPSILAAIYDDDPCGSLVTCSLAAALEDGGGARGQPTAALAAISPLTAAIRCKLALADGGYDRGATHDRDRGMRQVQRATRVANRTC